MKAAVREPRREQEMDIEARVRPVVESSGLELIEAAFHRDGGRRILRITVDREGGVDLQAISEVSERISRRLDLEDAVAGGRYTLEVSSPGVERPLRARRDFERRVGERVKVKTAGPIEGSRTHAGTLAAAGSEAIVLATDEGERRIPFDEIRSARTVFEWGPSSRPAAKR
jgi:ribosome maturation factor RimP